jgi:hypothetical protein
LAQGYQHVVTEEWYRSPAWEPEDREAFEARLARTRANNRAQYIRLKGVALAASTDESARRGARELLERVISEYADDKLQATMSRADLARWYEEEGDDARAARGYRASLAAERETGSLDTGSELRLVELIVRAQWSEAYPEALELLDQTKNVGLTFASERWRWLVAYARIAARTGESAAAADAAVSALRLLEDRRPDFPRHPERWAHSCRSGDCRRDGITGELARERRQAVNRKHPPPAAVASRQKRKSSLRSERSAFATHTEQGDLPVLALAAQGNLFVS